MDLTKRNKINSKKYGTRGEVTEQLAALLKALWACGYAPDMSTTFKVRFYDTFSIGTCSSGVF